MDTGWERPAAFHLPVYAMVPEGAQEDAGKRGTGARPAPPNCLKVLRGDLVSSDTRDHSLGQTRTLRPSLSVFLDTGVAVEFRRLLFQHRVRRTWFFSVRRSVASACFVNGGHREFSQRAQREGLPVTLWRGELLKGPLQDPP